MTEAVSLTLGILGLLGVALTALMYINPKWRLFFYLKNPTNWEEITLDLSGFHSIWRHKSHPEFTIERTEHTQEWSYDKTESWMKYPLPDPSKTTIVLHMKVGGTIVYVEHFITLDGGRYFVPLPRVKYNKAEKNNEYYYTKLQLKIAEIVGTFYRMKDIDEFVKHNEIEVREK